METKKIDSNFEIEIAIEKISHFLENLHKIYVFDYVKIKWLTSNDVTTEYILKGSSEIDYIIISFLKNENGTKILIHGEKKFSVEYFYVELEKIL